MLTRQTVPHLDRGAAKDPGVARGAYVLVEAEGGSPDVILIGTGSEVSLCVQAREKLKTFGVKARVVSMPCWSLFEAQEESYREGVLPPGVRKRVTVEAGSSVGWHRWAGDEGSVIGLERFGASAPGEEVLSHLGFTADHVTASALRLLGKNKEAESGIQPCSRYGEDVAAKVRSCFEGADGRFRRPGSLRGNPPDPRRTRYASLQGRDSLFGVIRAPCTLVAFENRSARLEQGILAGPSDQLPLHDRGWSSRGRSETEVVGERLPSATTAGGRRNRASTSVQAAGRFFPAPKFDIEKQWGTNRLVCNNVFGQQ